NAQRTHSGKIGSVALFLTRHVVRTAWIQFKRKGPGLAVFFPNDLLVAVNQGHNHIREWFAGSFVGSNPLEEEDDFLFSYAERIDIICAYASRPVGGWRSAGHTGASGRDQ